MQSGQTCQSRSALTKRSSRSTEPDFWYFHFQPWLHELLCSGYLVLGNRLPRIITRQRKSETALVGWCLQNPEILTRHTAHWYFPSSKKKKRQNSKCCIFEWALGFCVWSSESFKSKHHLQPYSVCILSPLPCSFSIIKNLFVQLKELRRISNLKTCPFQYTSLNTAALFHWRTPVPSMQGRNFSFFKGFYCTTIQTAVWRLI